MGKLMNVPKLRFPEFSEEWKGNELIAIAKFSKGKGVSKSEIAEGGKTECIRYGELYTRYGEVIDEVFSKTNVSVKDLVISEANDVIIPASGETQIDIATASCVIRSGIALGGDLNIIKTGCNGVFLSYYLNNKKKNAIANLAQGISVVHLYSSQLAQLELNLPHFTEQTKIASFITVIADKRTQLIKKKGLLEQYKEGLKQRIFSQELRFKDKEGNDFVDWEEVCIGDVFKLVIRPIRKPEGLYTALGIRSHFKGTFLKFESDPTKIDMDTLYVVHENDLIVNITFAWEGAVAIASKSDNGCLVSHRFPTYENVEDKINIDFFRFVYPNKKFKSELELISPGGAGRNRVLKKNEFLKIKIQIPSLPEQQKIASFLSALDDKIAQTSLQIEKIQLWKKGLLQQMFV